MTDWKWQAVKDFKLYAVTDIRSEDGAVLDKIDAAYRGGADIVQLRSKFVSDGSFCRLGIRVREIADRHKKLFLVNDRLDLAMALDADGVHLGQDDLPVARARNIMRACGRKMILGKSTHSLDQARITAGEDVDYIGVGPVFETPTKPDYAAVGLDLIQAVALEVAVPFVAIGGINSINLKSVMGAGAGRVAMVREIFNAGDVYEQTRKIRECIERYSHEHV